MPFSYTCLRNVSIKSLPIKQSYYDWEIDTYDTEKRKIYGLIWVVVWNIFVIDRLFGLSVVSCLWVNLL